MTKSESIGKLAKALSMAQKEIKGAVKDSNNPFFKTYYADLSSVWDACKEPLIKNGLTVIQTFDTAEHGVIVETTLVHESGEWISGRLQMKPTKDDPQGRGSAATYGRRYSLAAIAGVCPEDDDGEEAMGRKNKPSEQVAEEKRGVPASSPKPPAPPDPQKGKDFFRFIKSMGDEKARVGEDNYYAMLNEYGFKKSSEIHDPKKRVEVYKALKTLRDKEK